MKIAGVNGGVRITVKVVPNASREGIVGLLGDAVKVKVMQPPEGGKANRAVEAVIAKALGVAAGQARVVSGQSNARKVVEVRGISVETAAVVLGETTGPLR